MEHIFRLSVDNWAINFTYNILKICFCLILLNLVFLDVLVYGRYERCSCRSTIFTVARSTNAHKQYKIVSVPTTDV